MVEGKEFTKLTLKKRPLHPKISILKVSRSSETPFAIVAHDIREKVNIAKKLINTTSRSIVNKHGILLFPGYVRSHVIQPCMTLTSLDTKLWLNIFKLQYLSDRLLVFTST